MPPPSGSMPPHPDDRSGAAERGPDAGRRPEPRRSSSSSRLGTVVLGRTTRPPYLRTSESGRVVRPSVDPYRTASFPTTAIRRDLRSAHSVAWPLRFPPRRRPPAPASRARGGPAWNDGYRAGCLLGAGGRGGLRVSKYPETVSIVRGRVLSCKEMVTRPPAGPSGPVFWKPMTRPFVLLARTEYPGDSPTCTCLLLLLQ